MNHGVHHSWRRGEFEISTDPARINVAAVHKFLNSSYWDKGVRRGVVERSLRNSLCFGIYRGEQQAGLARVITDLATFAYVAEVFVIQPYQGRGLCKWLMRCIRSHPQLQGLRRWALVTRDAHHLFEKFGFAELNAPERWMEILVPYVNRNRKPIPKRRQVA